MSSPFILSLLKSCKRATVTENPLYTHLPVFSEDDDGYTKEINKRMENDYNSDHQKWLSFKNDKRRTSDNLDHEQGQEVQIGTVVGTDLAMESPEGR